MRTRSRIKDSNTSLKGWYKTNWPIRDNGADRDYMASSESADSSGGSVNGDSGSETSDDIERCA